MKWQTIIEGIVTGVSASLVIAATIIFRDRIRDIFLHRKIKKNCQKIMLGHGIHGAHVGIANTVGIPLTIRGVALVTDSGNIILNPSNEVKTTTKAEDRKLTKEEKKRLEAGEQILVSQDLSFTTAWQETKHPGGFVCVTPFTSRDWMLHPEINPKPETKFKRVRIEVEYQTYAKGINIMTVSTSHNLDMLKSMTDSLQQQLESGSFNLGRKRFGVFRRISG